MRRFAYLAPALCLALTLVTGIFSTPAHAVTYHLYDLGNDDYRHPYGLTDTGTAVFSGECPASIPTSPQCYRTYVNGVQVSVTGKAPSLPYDNGVACDPHGFQIDPGTGRCNGAFDTYHTDPANSFGALYAGLVGSETLIVSDLVDFVLINDVGDLIFDDISKEEVFEAVVTPEPSTLALLGTGCLGVAGAFRRRFARA